MDADVLVLGGGAVGLCCALHLGRQGRRVLLLERGAPGRETSFGNAGVISRGSILPLSLPGLAWKLPRYALNRDPAVRLDPRILPRLLPWLARFLRHAGAAQARRAAMQLNGLLSPALAEHRILLRDAGAEGLLREAGWLKLYRSEAGEAAGAFERSLLREAGVRFEALDGAGVAALEPALAARFHGGLWVQDCAAVTDPGALCDAYAALLQREGGRIERGEVTAILPAGEGWSARLPDGERRARDLVVALGPWSPDLLRPLGYRVPMIWERGYHRHYRARGNAALQRPILDVERAYVLAPMSRGIRLTTGIEFAPREAPPRPVQLIRAAEAAAEIFPLGEAVDAAPWLGRRPSLPDSLPAIGRLPRHSALWAAFGHGHIGLATSAVTGRLLSQLLVGECPAVDAAPFDPARLF